MRAVFKDPPIKFFFKIINGMCFVSQKCTRGQVPFESSRTLSVFSKVVIKTSNFLLLYIFDTAYRYCLTILSHKKIIEAACPYMLLVSLIRCTNQAHTKLHLKSTIKCFKEVKIDKWPDLISYSFLPIDCFVRINSEPDRLFSGDIQS